jgi:hypothetical protein
MIIQNDILTDMSLYLDEYDNIRMSNDSFFKLFCYNEYVKDTYNTNKLSHYENILRENKFVLNSIVDKIKISEDIKAEMADLRSDINEALSEE